MSVRVVAGQVWRTDTGGRPLVVVDVDERFAYVKRNDSSKRELSRRAGAQVAALSEFETWTLLEDVGDAADRAVDACLEVASREGQIETWNVPAELGGGDVEVEVVYVSGAVRTYRTDGGVPERLS